VRPTSRGIMVKVSNLGLKETNSALAAGRRVAWFTDELGGHSGGRLTHFLEESAELASGWGGSRDHMAWQQRRCLYLDEKAFQWVHTENAAATE